MALARGTIPRFLAEIQQNAYLETNKFEVILYPPQGLPNYDAVIAEAMTLRAESINMAGRNISSFDESNIYGPIKQIPDGITYGEDISMLFVASENMAERDYIENWQQMIYDSKNWDLNYYNDFIGTIDIYTVSKHNDGGKDKGNIQGPQMVRTFGIRFQEVWPKTLGATEMSHSSGSELIKIPVSFAYRYWDRLDPTSSDELVGNIGF